MSALMPAQISSPNGNAMIRIPSTRMLWYASIHIASMSKPFSLFLWDVCVNNHFLPAFCILRFYPRTKRGSIDVRPWRASMKKRVCSGGSTANPHSWAKALYPMMEPLTIALRPGM